MKVQFSGLPQVEPKAQRWPSPPQKYIARKLEPVISARVSTLQAYDSEASPSPRSQCKVVAGCEPISPVSSVSGGATCVGLLHRPKEPGLWANKYIYDFSRRTPFKRVCPSTTFSELGYVNIQSISSPPQSIREISPHHTLPPIENYL